MTVGCTFAISDCSGSGRGGLATATSGFLKDVVVVLLIAVIIVVIIFTLTLVDNFDSDITLGDGNNFLYTRTASLRWWNWGWSWGSRCLASNGFASDRFTLEVGEAIAVS